MATQPFPQSSDVNQPPSTTHWRWRVARVFGFGLTSIVGLLVVAVAIVYVVSQSRLNQRYELAVDVPPIPIDAASLARGKHLASANTGCTDCHGSDLAGKVFADAPPFLLVASNLTSGVGGVGSSYSDADWVRAIRYGVRPDGRSLLFMSSSHFNKLSNEDLAAIIGYLKSVAPVDHQQARSTLRLLGRLLVVLGEYQLPAETVDRDMPIPATPPVGRTVEYGQYLVGIGACSECHGANLAGAPPLEPGLPPGANLTPGGNVGQWSEAQFIQIVRTGRRPDGTLINIAMPWWVLAQQSDDELGAIYRYLHSLPALPTES